ncbi:MAG TPA: UMP kinase [Candidatus Bathyarchaeia archaeon]|nr:UMP kinase [Candidatus Bathyarchaeia archaeon]
MRTRILLKLSGLFLQQPNPAAVLEKLAHQLKKLSSSHQFGIVIGGGNFFRGDQQGKQYQLTPSYGHTIGMLATVMNALILEDLLTKAGIMIAHFCALSIPTIGQPLDMNALHKALMHHDVILFSGGTGNPFFTTDTTAFVRALQIDAQEVWKATMVDGIYTKDPQVHADAQYLDTVSYAYALEHDLRIFDTTAYVLGKTHAMPARVFNSTTPDALVRAAQDPTFGSRIQ